MGAPDGAPFVASAKSEEEWRAEDMRASFLETNKSAFSILLTWNIAGTMGHCFLFRFKSSYPFKKHWKHPSEDCNEITLFISIKYR